MHYTARADYDKMKIASITLVHVGLNRPMVGTSIHRVRAAPVRKPDTMYRCPYVIGMDRKWTVESSAHLGPPVLATMAWLMHLYKIVRRR